MYTSQQQYNNNRTLLDFGSIVSAIIVASVFLFHIGYLHYVIETIIILLVADMFVSAAYRVIHFFMRR